jgi:ferrous iron transport protein A
MKIMSGTPRKLNQLAAGADATVIAVDFENRAARRLMEMGVIPGVSIKVIKTAPFGDPIEIRVRGYHLALRKSEALAVDITD